MDARIPVAEILDTPVETMVERGDRLFQEVQSNVFTLKWRLVRLKAFASLAKSLSNACLEDVRITDRTTVKQLLDMIEAD